MADDDSDIEVLMVSTTRILPPHGDFISQTGQKKGRRPPVNGVKQERRSPVKAPVRVRGAALREEAAGPSEKLVSNPFYCQVPNPQPKVLNAQPRVENALLKVLNVQVKTEPGRAKADDMVSAVSGQQCGDLRGFLNLGVFVKQEKEDRSHPASNNNKNNAQEISNSLVSAQVVGYNNVQVLCNNRQNNPAVWAASNNQQHAPTVWPDSDNRHNAPAVCAVSNNRQHAPAVRPVSTNQTSAQAFSSNQINAQVSNNNNAQYVNNNHYHPSHLNNSSKSLYQHNDVSCRHSPYLMNNAKRNSYVVNNAKRNPYVVNNAKRNTYVVYSAKRSPYVVNNVKRNAYELNNVPSNHFAMSASISCKAESSVHDGGNDRQSERDFIKELGRRERESSLSRSLRGHEDADDVSSGAPHRPPRPDSNSSVEVLEPCVKAAPPVIDLSSDTDVAEREEGRPRAVVSSEEEEFDRDGETPPRGEAKRHVLTVDLRAASPPTPPAKSQHLRPEPRAAAQRPDVWRPWSSPVQADAPASCPSVATPSLSRTIEGKEELLEKRLQQGSSSVETADTKLAAGMGLLSSLPAKVSSLAGEKIRRETPRTPPDSDASRAGRTGPLAAPQRGPSSSWAVNRHLLITPDPSTLSGTKPLKRTPPSSSRQKTPVTASFSEGSGEEKTRGLLKTPGSPASRESSFQDSAVETEDPQNS